MTASNVNMQNDNYEKYINIILIYKSISFSSVT